MSTSNCRDGIFLIFKSKLCVQSFPCCHRFNPTNPFGPVPMKIQIIRSCSSCDRESSCVPFKVPYAATWPPKIRLNKNTSSHKGVYLMEEVGVPSYSTHWMGRATPPRPSM